MIKSDKGQQFEKVQKQKVIYIEPLTTAPIHFHSWTPGGCSRGFRKLEIAPVQVLK